MTLWVAIEITYSKSVLLMEAPRSARVASLEVHLSVFDSLRCHGGGQVMP
jgi:hypothetical protein